MKKISLKGILLLFLMVFCLSLISLKGKDSVNRFTAKSNIVQDTPIDTTLINAFFGKYPKLVVYKVQVDELYKKYSYNYIWHDNKGRKEIADVIYDKINNLKAEGVSAEVPYKEDLDVLFQQENKASNPDVELFLSAYYFYYTNKVIRGMDESKMEELEWYLPRKKLSYLDYLDSLSVNPKLLDEKHQQIEQYYKLKTVLQKYRDIEQKGGWKPIKLGSDFKRINPGDTSNIVAKIRTRLFLSGDIATDSKSKVYGKALQDAVLKYKKRNGFSAGKIILPKHIRNMNIPVDERIKTIMVNMERCRWISPDVVENSEYIVVNIPSYRLVYFKNGKQVLISNVVVGDIMNKTVVFSGMMSYIVFCPYWNIPQSIIKKEILPQMEKNKNYLSEKNMEWNGGNIRQKPGPGNSLGQVKFLFPNSNNIYLHDSPAKEFFKEENRAFSHGCIRVAKPIELANKILQNEPGWTAEKTQTVLKKGKETWVTLTNQIPVFIGYFTAWTDEDGTVNFYNDIYGRDERLKALLLED